jgi:DNA repair ATPase RecN
MELARMMGDENQTREVRDHAEQLLRRAQTRRGLTERAGVE